MIKSQSLKNLKKKREDNFTNTCMQKKTYDRYLSHIGICATHDNLFILPVCRVLIFILFLILISKHLIVLY
jgi:hypothetical protein